VVTRQKRVEALSTTIQIGGNMITSPRATLSASGSAIIARERLLQDPTVRQPSIHQADPGPPQPSSAAFWTPHPNAMDNGLLSSSEQKQQALSVARSFRDHYLSEIAFFPEDNITLAVVRPSAAQKDTSYAITVDATGNTNVEPVPGQGTSPQRLRRVLLGTSTIVLIIALLILAVLI
jgi:hypothetical protein